MARLTKRSYNRKLIMVGVMLFIGIGLVSTGFAAWVMSSNAEKPGSGNVIGATISDQSMEIKLENADNLGSFIFGAAPDDTTGRIRGNGKEVESLKITISGTVKPTDFLNNLYVNLELPKGVKDACDQGYLVAPDCVTADSVDLKAGAVGATFDTSSGAFTYEIEFKWGEKFGNMNPSLYYDTDKIANPEYKETTYKDDATMKQEMHDFRVLLNEGKPIEDEAPLELEFIVTVKAIAN